MKPRSGRLPRVASQRGATLIVALVLLVVVTLLGVASLRGVLLQERMAANQYDRSLAFQAAEAALRAAEAYVEANVPVPSGTNCASGVCPTPDPAATPRWEDSDFTGWQNVSTDLGKLAGTAPQYIIEYMGGDFPCDPRDPTGSAAACKRYRITARSNPGNDRATVMLQSVYAIE